MALTQFRSTPEHLQPPQPQRQLNFEQGTPDISEAVGVSLEAMKLLGLAPLDLDQATEELTTDFTTLIQPNYNGRLYVLPSEQTSLAHMLTVAEGNRAESVNTAYVYSDLWTPGTEPNSFTDSELNQGPKAPEARLAIFSSVSKSDKTLHYLDLPYDDQANNSYHNGNYSTTQLKELAADELVFTSKHPEYTLTPTDVKSFMMHVLMDRIRGQRTEVPLDPTSPDFILNKGFMRLPDLGRRTVDGDSIVSVYSGGSRVGLGRSYGHARGRGGVGLSMGIKES